MENKQIEIILRNVQEIGQKLKGQRNFKINQKSGIQDLVTSMDKNTEIALRQCLREVTPDCTFIGEEGTQEMSKKVWIIDPIDGTTNFINSQEGYAISLGYFEDAEPVLGIVYDVASETLYHAFDQRAYINGIQVQDLPEIRSLSESVWDAGMATMHKNPKLFDLCRITRGHRELGSAALAIIKVALGKLDFYVTENAKCWDYAGGIPFLKACQGTYWMRDDFFTCTPNLMVVARSEEVLEQVKSYLK